MTASRDYFAARYAAQEARRAGQARADDSTYREQQHSTRWQAASEVVDTGATDAGASGRATPDAGALYPLVALCRQAQLPEPVPEYQFHPTRRWRFDYAWPLHKLALEVEGGIWRRRGGAHSHPSNIVRDCEKYSEAALLGWRILRVPPEKMRTVGMSYLFRALA